jgi:molybdopterin-guanine dinucleotide biosynthesis protein A
MITIAALLFVTVTSHRIEKVVGVAWGEVEGAGCFNDRQYRAATMPRLKLRSPVATKRANAIIEAEVRDMIDYGGPEFRHEPMPGVCKGKKVEKHAEVLQAACDVTLASERFVSVLCHVTGMGAHPGGHPEALNLLVNGDEVEQLGEFEELFRRGSDYRSALFPNHAVDDLQSATLEEDGLHLIFNDDDMFYEWKYVDDILRPEIVKAHKK